jgi:hypothetical protein
MQEHRVGPPRRIWTHAEGPYRRRVRLCQTLGECAENIVVEIRDHRQPGVYRYRSLSLGHADRERAIKYAQVLVRYWRIYGKPPALVWRPNRHGPQPRTA